VTAARHDVHTSIAEAIVRCGAAKQGPTWHFDRPPVIGLDIETGRRVLLVEWVVA